MTHNTSWNWTLVGGILMAGCFARGASAAPQSSTASSSQEATTIPFKLEPTTMPDAGSMRAIDNRPGIAMPANVIGDEPSTDAIEQLMQVDVSTGTLTQTTRQLAPAAITLIDRDMIHQANALSMNELLDVYVPDLEFVNHNYEQIHLGMRGIISERDDEYLMLTNGRVMNERTHVGALSERESPLLGDLDQIEVVRGPGSATYGPGAISMVINQRTLSGLTYQGTELTGRVGSLDEMYALEFKHGQKSDDTHGWFVYAGIAQVDGASRQNSPIVQGYSWDTPGVGSSTAGHPMDFNYIENHRGFMNRPDLKFHVQVDAGDLCLWARYTQGGEAQSPGDRGIFAPFPIGYGNGQYIYSGYGYAQATLFGGYKHDLTDTLHLEASASIDGTEYERLTNGVFDDSYVEEKFINQGLLRWTPNKQNEIAGGVELQYFQFGLPSWDNPQLGGLDDSLPGESQQQIGATYQNPQRPWTAHMYSVFGEYQFHLNDQLTFFASAREDKHSYTDWLFSPRGAIVYAPTEKDTYKLMASRSLRTNIEESMRQDFLTTGQLTKPEEDTTYELRYERQQSKNLLLAGSIFYNDIQVLGLTNGGGQSRGLLGTYQDAGAEVEANYRADNTTFTLSHSYTKMIGQNFGANQTFLTSANLGSGFDLASWSNNLTKFTIHQDITHKWSVDTSLRLYWGFPGDKAYTAWLNLPANQFAAGFPGAAPSTLPNYNKPFGVSAFLNLGTEYKFDSHASIRFDAYNILGWADMTLNKRGFFAPTWQGVYRAEAPAVAVTMKYAF